jgi:hypothetical protein
MKRRAMSDNKTELLKETLSLFNMLGVIPGQGADGKLMSKIMDELSGDAPPRVTFTMPRGRCPCCGAPDLMNCDCNPDDQLAAFEARK